MRVNNIFNFSNDQQFFIKPRIGRVIMDDKAFATFVIDCIRECAAHLNDRYVLFACDLPREYKLIFLSYLSSAEDYEWYCQNPTRLLAAFDEYEKDMQQFIDSNIDDVYHSDMWEMTEQLSPNAEYYYGARR